MLSIIFIFCLLYHTYTDMKSMLLYDKVTLLLVAVGVVRAFFEHQLLEALYGAGAMLVIMLLLYFVSRGGMGLVWSRGCYVCCWLLSAVASWVRYYCCVDEAD